jgi:hypothetical protein
MHITIPLQSVDHLASCVKERLRAIVTGRRTYKEEKSEEICGPSFWYLFVVHPMSHYPVQSSDVGKSKAKSTRAKKPTQPLSKEEETIKELKVSSTTSRGSCTSLTDLTRAGPCKGVRCAKIWSKELNGLDLNSQITHIRKILSDLGMKGRMSIGTSHKDP